MNKYIHYCWFGDKPLPKLAKKCINSWKKYLPDYEIIKWNEENVNIDECPFIKEAYRNKKWAFVADYARTKALKEMGGIYFDTDMEIKKDISDLLNNNTFLGLESTGFVAVGVWYEKNKNAYLPTSLYEVYRSMKEFDQKKMYEMSIPILISNILEKDGLEYGASSIQVLKNNICIYPRDYFYPYSYDRTDNLFTDNTCMIHYYDASWVPVKDRIENNMVRSFGVTKTHKILNTYRKTKKIARIIGKPILFPIVLYKKNKRKKELITDKYTERINKTIKEIEKKKNSEYIVIYNTDWLGVTSATTELFENRIDCGEVYRKQDAKRIANTILNAQIKQVIFSSFAIGYKEIIANIKNKKHNIKIKTYWHGSHSQVLDTYGWKRNMEIINLHKKGLIDVMASCKYSLQDFYKKEGYKSYFLTNKVILPDNFKNSKNNKNNEIRIGIYAANCSDWRKNMFSQIAAVSLIKDAIIDMVPLNETAKKFASIIGVKMEGVEKALNREELLKRMANNSVNLYVTFSECAPMLPLESFEVDVPCITGNNHHYFQNSILEELVVVNNEENPLEIKEKIMNCINNKNKIMNEYKLFRKKNLKISEKQIKEFIEM